MYVSATFAPAGLSSVAADARQVAAAPEEVLTREGGSEKPGPARTSRPQRTGMRRLREYLDVVIARDPSVRSRSEALLHPSVVAVLGHGAARRLYQHGLYKSARALSLVARVASGGIEIHPGAQIGERFFVDHGCGVVIGETAVIGDDVTLFHQVTLGSSGWWKAVPGERRHPRLGDGVTVGANATLLGAIDVGDNTIIGAQSLVTSDVPADTVVYAPRATVVEKSQDSAARGRLPPAVALRQPLHEAAPLLHRAV
jgi:serine O-acetyltransferase